MSKYFIPVEIGGKWWIVENAPGEEMHLANRATRYYAALESCTKYPTLPSDSAYWASKAGVKMTSEEFEFDPCCDYLCNGLCKEIGNTKYAVPLRGVDKAPIQSPTTKELIEREAERLFHADTEGVFHKPSWLDGATFALSLPKQHNGDAWDEAEKQARIYADSTIKIQDYTDDSGFVDVNKFHYLWLRLYNDYLKQHYSISKIK